MKITKRQLRRIIKEETARSMRVEPDVQAGLWQNAVDGIWRWLDDEAMAGTVDMSDPAVQGTFADALETVASELRKGSQS